MFFIAIWKKNPKPATTLNLSAGLTLSSNSQGYKMFSNYQGWNFVNVCCMWTEAKWINLQRILHTIVISLVCSLLVKNISLFFSRKSQELKGCSNLVITYKVAFMQKVVWIPSTDQEMIPHSYAKKLIFTGFGQIDRCFLEHLISSSEMIRPW